MNRIFSNGPLKDFVINPFTNIMHQSTRLYIAAPYVTETTGLLDAAKRGTTVDLLVGLNTVTDPQALLAVHGISDFAVRYLTHRFHAKIYISDTAALLGSSNLTDGGLRSNREATIRLDQPDDLDAIEELRALFLELWNSAQVLTTEKLKIFTEVHDRMKRSGPNPDSLIEAAVGRAEPFNINVQSTATSPERIFLQQLSRQVYEQYRPAFTEVINLLEQNGFRRAELQDVGIANETNRFLNWVRLTYVPEGEAWESTPLQSQGERRATILRLGKEWVHTSQNKVPDYYVNWLRRVHDIFGTSSSIEAASQEQLTEGLLSIHAFAEQTRFVPKGTLPNAFWNANNHDIAKVKKTLIYLIHGRRDFLERLHDVLYDPTMKLGYFGRFCALELFGTIKPDEFPPVNGRMAKALRFLGFDVRGR